MAFHEIQFPPTLSFGSVGGPERRTDIVTLGSGYEERNTPWAQSRHRYNAGVGLRSLDDMAALIAFFEARAGQMHGFRWKDWADYTSCLPSAKVAHDDQVIGQGDGEATQFQLLKTYVSGQGSYARVISKPVQGTVRMGVQSDELFEGTDYTVDTTTGIVTLAHAPAAGLVVTAGYEFDVPVRFDTDLIQTSIASFRAGEAPDVPVIEVRV